jgi:hypothetical protein
MFGGTYRVGAAAPEGLPGEGGHESETAATGHSFCHRWEMVRPQRGRAFRYLVGKEGCWWIWRAESIVELRYH